MTTLIVVVCIVSTAIVGACVLVARAVWAFTSEISKLRAGMTKLGEKIAALRLEMTEQRSADRLEVRALIEQKLDIHSQLCPAARGTSRR